MVQIDTFSFKGLRALVRVDFNVPFNDAGEITDDTRMRAALPTLQKILNTGGTAVIVAHLGRPKGVDPTLSLCQIVKHLESLVNRPVLFIDTPIGQGAKEAINQAPENSVILLENIRFYEEEEGKLRNADAYVDLEELKRAKDDLRTRQAQFAKELATLADVYVNDAFGAAHRAHASTALVAAHFPLDKKMFGYLMCQEVQAVERVLETAQKPFTAIIGGAKVSSKIDVIRNLINKVDNLIIVGGMAYTFVKALGGEIGQSLVEDDKLQVAQEILDLAKEKGVALILPSTTVATEKFAPDAPAKVFPTKAIPQGWMGMDIAPESTQELTDIILQSKTILWNGPAGVFEFDRFAQGSGELAKAIAQATQKGAYSLVGGGDSVACIHKLGLEKEISYVSTGGGALLEAIEGKTLPGIAGMKA